MRLTLFKGSSPLFNSFTLTGEPCTKLTQYDNDAVMRIAVIEENIAPPKGIAYRRRDRGHLVDRVHAGDEADAFLWRESARRSARRGERPPNS